VTEKAAQNVLREKRTARLPPQELQPGDGNGCAGDGRFAPRAARHDGHTDGQRKHHGRPAAVNERQIFRIEADPKAPQEALQDDRQEDDGAQHFDPRAPFFPGERRAQEQAGDADGDAREAMTVLEKLVPGGPPQG